MPWISKEHAISTPETTLEGAWYLDGDIVAKTHQTPHSPNKTFPLIEFPSGLRCELLQQDQSFSVRLLDDLTLPLKFGDDTAQQPSDSSSEYKVKQTDKEIIDVWKVGYGGRFRATLDPQTRQIRDITYLPDEPLAQLAPRPMELLDTESRAYLPPLYTQENKGLQAIAPVKFFTPDSSWTWYASEFDGQDIFFGLVSGWMVELGYFSLADLEQIRGPLGLTVERDLYYQPRSLQDLKDEHENTLYSS